MVISAAPFRAGRRSLRPGPLTERSTVQGDSGGSSESRPSVTDQFKQLDRRPRRLAPRNCGLGARPRTERVRVPHNCRHCGRLACRSKANADRHCYRLRAASQPLSCAPCLRMLASCVPCTSLMPAIITAHSPAGAEPLASVIFAEGLNDLPTSTSTWSPKWCPNVSLMVLKWPMSHIRTTAALSRRPDVASIATAASSDPRRFRAAAVYCWSIRLPIIRRSS